MHLSGPAGIQEVPETEQKWKRVESTELSLFWEPQPDWVEVLAEISSCSHFVSTSHLSPVLHTIGCQSEMQICLHAAPTACISTQARFLRSKQAPPSPCNGLGGIGSMKTVRMHSALPGVTDLQSTNQCICLIL